MLYEVITDPFGNPVTLPNGRVTVQGGAIVYEPKANFYGNDYFTYTITDSVITSYSIHYTKLYDTQRRPPGIPMKTRRSYRRHQVRCRRRCRSSAGRTAKTP